MSRKYRKEWEEDPLFQPWLSNDPTNIIRAYCKVCGFSITPKKDIIRNHGACKTHIQNMENVSTLKRTHPDTDNEETHSLKRLCVKKCDNLQSLDECSNSQSFDSDNVSNKKLIGENVLMSQKMYENAADNDITDATYFSKQLRDDNPHSKFRDDNPHSFNQDIMSNIVADDCHKYMHTFRPDWQLTMDWLKPVPGNKLKVACIYCNTILTANISILKDHAGTKKHCLNVGLEDIFNNFNYQKAMTEIKISAMIVARSLSFLYVEHFDKFTKTVYFDSMIAQNVKINRHKVTSIASNVIAPTYKETLTSILKKVPFSISIDESTDITTQQSICIVVRYFHEESTMVRDALWDLVPVFDGDENRKADADTIFNKVFSVIKNADVPVENVIAFCSDTCNLMMGMHNSVSEKFVKAIPGIKIIKCACHIQHLCARDGIKSLPNIYELIPSLFHNYLIHSSNRCNRWDTLQIKSKVKVLKILKPITTRWLSYYLCMERILSRWTVANRFFEAECQDSLYIGDDPPPDIILLRYFSNPVNKLYHAFIVSIYRKLYIVNVTLQTEKPIVPKENNIIRELYISLLNMYMDGDFNNDTDLAEIDPSNIKMCKSINNIVLEPMVEKEFANINSDSDKMTFLCDCKRFLRELCLRLKQRFNFEDELLMHIKCFHPENALSSSFHNEQKTLDAVFQYLPKLTNFHDAITMININEEWEELLNFHLPQEILEEQRPESFWYKIGKCIDEDGHFLFQNISTLALKVLCLQNSNAPSERIWSDYNLEKPKCRASLDFANIRGILLTLQCVRDAGGIEFFEPTHGMYARIIRNLQDKKVMRKDIADYSTYKGIPCTSAYIKQCQDEEKSRFKIRKNVKVQEQYPLLSGDSMGSYSDYKALLEIEEPVPDWESQSLMSNDYKVLPEIIEHTVDCITPANNYKNLEQKPYHFLNNGLIDNYRYYFTKLTYLDSRGQEKEKLYTVAKYIREISASVKQNFELDSGQFHSLKPKTYIDGEVINACASVYEKDWQNATFISTRETFTLFMDQWTALPGDWWLLFQMKFPSTGKMVLPYLQQSHWRLFMVDIDQKIMSIIDPFDVGEQSLNRESTRIRNLLQRYANICSAKNITNILSSYKQCKMISVAGKRPFQNDGYSCGVFVIYYMEVIGKNVTFDAKFDPEKHRMVLCRMLLDQSQDMQSTCLFCFHGNMFDTIKCEKCRRLSHYECSKDFICNNVCRLCSNN